MPPQFTGNQIAFKADDWEVVMRLGFALPQIGKAAGPDAVAAVARRAEELGFDSLWVLDRLLYPEKPRAPYPVGDGTLPVQYKTALDPLQTLAFAAAQTERIVVGSSVLNLPWYSPVMLARSLASLDVLSRGRLRVGLGMGWSPDEYEAAGVSWSNRGKRADELIRALKTIWTTNPVAFEGEYVRIPKSFIEPKPVQKPHPPIYMAAYAPSAMQRVAREANGWFPVGVPIKVLPEMFKGIKGMVKDAGRNPDELDLIVRCNVELSESPVSGERADFVGTLDQIESDIAATKEVGTAELVLDVQFSPGVETKEDYLTCMEQLWEAAKP